MLLVVRVFERLALPAHDLAPEDTALLTGVGDEVTQTRQGVWKVVQAVYRLGNRGVADLAAAGPDQPLKARSVLASEAARRGAGDQGVESAAARGVGGYGGDLRFDVLRTSVMPARRSSSPSRASRASALNLLAEAGSARSVSKCSAIRVRARITVL